MKFLWIVKRDWRHPGPIVHVALRNAHALALQGQETHFVLGAGAVSDTARDLAEHYGLESPVALHIHRIPRQGVFASRPILKYALELVKNLRRKDEQRLTIITRETTYLPALVALLRDRKIRVLYEAHDYFVDLSVRESRPTLQDHRLSVIEKTVLGKISGLIAITPGQARLYQERFENLPILALPLGTEPQIPNPGQYVAPSFQEEVLYGGEHLQQVIARRLARPLLVYVGHLNSFKGTKLLAKAARKIFKATGCQTAFWGGSEAQITRFRGSAVKQKQTTYTEVKGFMAPARLRELLATRATLGALPLLDTFYNRHLTCPVKALDYISHGLPVIASDLPTNRWLLQDAALYHTPGDVDSLVQSVVCALTKQTYDDLARSALRRARALSYRKRAQRLIDFCKDLHGLHPEQRN